MMRVLQLARKLPHIMDFTDIRVLEATFALLRKGIENILQYQDEHPDFPLEMGQMTAFMQKWLLFCTIWGVGGSMNLAVRTKFGNDLAEMTDVEMPSLTAADLIDYDIRMEDQKWYLFKERVPDLDIEPRQVLDADFVITTTDTERHQQVLCSWLSEHRPFILCGPPGSGKTMTLMATLKMVSDMEMIFINFSSGTTPSLILKTFDHYCVEKKTRKGIVLQPH
jgi:dynein heavy chain 1